MANEKQKPGQDREIFFPDTIKTTWVIAAVFPGESTVNALCCLSLSDYRSCWSADDWTLDFDTREEAERIEREYLCFENARKLGATDVFLMKVSHAPDVSRETLELPSTIPPAVSPEQELSDALALQLITLGHSGPLNGRPLLILRAALQMSLHFANAAENEALAELVRSALSRLPW